MNTSGKQFPRQSPPTPAEGDWPCQTEPDRPVPPRLVAFLYRLHRDFMHPGDVEQVLLDITPDHAGCRYTNKHLEALAGAHAHFLQDDSRVRELERVLDEFDRYASADPSLDVPDRGYNGSPFEMRVKTLLQPCQVSTDEVAEVVGGVVDAVPEDLELDGGLGGGRLAVPILHELWRLEREKAGAGSMVLPDVPRLRAEANAIADALRPRVAEIAFTAAGAATAPMMRDHPHYVFPSERVAAGVDRALLDFGIDVATVQGYGSVVEARENPPAEPVDDIELTEDDYTYTAAEHAGARALYEAEEGYDGYDDGSKLHVAYARRARKVLAAAEAVS